MHNRAGQQSTTTRQTQRRATRKQRHPHEYLRHAPTSYSLGGDTPAPFSSGASPNGAGGGGVVAAIVASPSMAVLKAESSQCNRKFSVSARTARSSAWALAAQASARPLP